MKRFGPLRAILMSFYSSDLYRGVVRNWRGAGVLYLTLLLALCWLPSAGRWFVGLRAFAATEAPQLAGQRPQIASSHHRRFRGQRAIRSRGAGSYPVRRFAWQSSPSRR
jgi:hypothetical protein